MGEIKNIRQSSKFPELISFSFEPHMDFRGTWQRIWEHHSINDIGHNPEVRQVSLSTNPKKNTLRGLHSLKFEASEYKAVVCLTGAAQDVVVDVRPNSETWGHYASFNLSEGDFSGLLIPPGFAHGFLTLLPETRLLYLMSAEHSETLESNFCWNDPEFAIEWLAAPILISEKDKNIPWVASR